MKMRTGIADSFMLVFSILMVLGLESCTQTGGDFTGREFIPDMAHSVAYEANVAFDYSLNTWDDKSVFKRRALVGPRNPVPGTIARGYSGNIDADVVSNVNAFAHTPNGAVPYYFPDTEEGRAQATDSIRSNPFPITISGLERGKNLYNIYCSICHGEKGDGAGYLVRDDGGVYPAQPANLVNEQFISATEGRFYHAIMYGLNVMGPHKDKLSYEERWQVIHYIRSLQADATSKKYSPTENTLTANE